MYKPFLLIASILGAVSVIAGAFGAHALKEKLSAETLQIFETAVKYQFYHVFALITAGMLCQSYNNAPLLWSGRLFIIGTIIFCGSLYALTFFKASGTENMNWLGAITPLGGLCFIAGWISLFIGILKG